MATWEVMVEDELLTVEEVSERTGLSIATVRRRASGGSFAGARKVGRQWLVPRNAVPSGTRRTRNVPPSAGIDVAASLVQLERRDLIEVWVPDILRFEDVLAKPASLHADAISRIANRGPFDAAQEVEYPKTPFLSRPGLLLAIEDRLAFHACIASLLPRIEAITSDVVFSARASADPRYLLRNGRDLWLEWNEAVEVAIDDGYAWMVKADVTSYFENIEHRVLFADIDALNPDPTVAAALKRMLGEWAAMPGRGIPQGPDASRLLGNLYMLAVDDVMATGPWRYFRYMDDLRVLGRSREEVVEGVRVLQRECRRRGLVLSASKSDLLIGDDARDDLRDPELDGVEYWLNAGNTPVAAKQLRSILKSSLARQGVVSSRRATFSLYRLRGLRDHRDIRLVLDNLERLGSIIQIAAQYLRPFLGRRRVTEGIVAFFKDGDRNTSAYVSTWLLALMLEAPQPLPPDLVPYARRVFSNRNEPPYHRVMAANVLALGRRAADIRHLGDTARTDYDPSIVRGCVVALARISALTRDIERAAVRRAPEVASTLDYLRGRRKLPSLIYRAADVPL
jgi:hypothetical protein